VRAFLRGPDSINGEKFARAFAVSVLPGGDGNHVSIRDEISEVEDLHLDWVCNGLAVFQEKLSDFPRAVPDRLQESIDQLKEGR
jgi:hypothetical protein